MIILPERNAPRGRVLLPQRPQEWQRPRQQTQFRITGRLNDGHIVWRGHFDDREDADAFLLSLISGSLIHDRNLWRLPTPWWHPDFGEGLTYDFVTVTFLTTPTGSNQTYNIPSDFNAANNNIQAIGAGASGGHGDPNVDTADTGGGGGAYAKSVNLSLTPGGTATYQIGTGGAAVSAFSTNGNAGGDSWFNSAAFPAAGQAVGAKGGSAGVNDATSILVSGSSGGTAAASYATGTGSVKNSGGSSGSADGTGGIGIGSASGAGGAGGPNGAGVAGTGAASATGSAGGAGDNGSGGGGGAGNSSGSGSGGGNGTEFDATHGSGGGGGGGMPRANNDTGGSGGLYGAGGGAAYDLTRLLIGTASGAGRQGIIVVTYTPTIFTAAFGPTNVPVRIRLGMVPY